MNARMCARVWEAEAIEDGRLVDADRASYERHAAGCAECRRELGLLAEVRARMLLAPEPARTPLQRRAERTAILRRANGDYVRAGAPRAFGRLAFALAVPLLVLLGFVGRGIVGRRHLDVAIGQAAGSTAATPSFQVLDARGAVWSSATDGPVTRVSLRAGVASFHIEPIAPGRRFFVVLPDGELEVRGTRFVVDVEAGATRSVEVTEGVVALRLAGRTELALRAGERWSVAGAAAAAWTSAPPATTASSDPATPPSHPVTPTSATSVAPAGAIVAPNTASSTTATKASSTGKAASPADERYAEAIGAYRVGAYAKADALFAAFIRDYPSNPSCEDAAFLRAVCRQRLGDAPGAATLARAYLARYPSGLRRPEAEQLAAPPKE